MKFGSVLDRARALIFDFDGTLVDSNPIKLQAFEKVFEGFPRREEIMAYCRGNNHTTRTEKFRWVHERILGRPYTPEIERDLSRIFEKESTAAIIRAPEIPGARRFLEGSGRTRPLGLLSATPHEILLEILSGRGWSGWFRWIQGAPVRKDLWLSHLREREGWEGDQVVFFGDTPEDAEAGRQAGCTFVAMGTAARAGKGILSFDNFLPLLDEPQILEDWMKRVREITACRICGNASLKPVIDLGAQALASLFDDGRTHNQLADWVPLEVVCCDTAARPGACGFVQLRHTVPPEVMFRDYGYRSGINTTMRTHLQGLAREAESEAGLKAGELVLDIGANDGTLLLSYGTPGLRRVGFEPSDIRPLQAGHGIEYIPSFFGVRPFQKACPGAKARLVTSIAMFYDIDDPASFCRDVRQVLADDGIWVIEMGYWGAILENAGFDSICHEHLGYYTLASLEWLARQTGFELFDLSFNASNGGSLRAYLSPKGSPRPVPPENHARMESARWEEERRGYLRSERHRKLRDQAENIRRDLRQVLDSARREGKVVYGYGASTKGNVLLQYCGIGPNDLVAIADRNPAKRGRVTPATRIPICSEDEMRGAEPDLLLVLPWHFVDEFLERERGIRSAGARFIVPFPRVRIL